MNPENIPPKMNVRCYGYRTRSGSWIASCVDLSLMVERPSMQESIKALQEQIVLYVRSVLDTEHKESISYLLPRPAPWSEQLLYQLISMACRFKRICKGTAFNFTEEYPLPQAA
jgi:hypothetical protein